MRCGSGAGAARWPGPCPILDDAGTCCLIAAAHGPVRFTELERALNGISRRMLTLNLRRLERDGLLTRTVHPTVPPNVEYGLTPMARELHASLTGLAAWAERHRSATAAAGAAYDTAAEQGPAAD
ncbi:hypothetical protein GCM10010271_41210 [Streptomyces kurssanovii]|nr:hypothetical protein GCM10010271_41210 [Streptomyces kurssanovii]